MKQRIELGPEGVSNTLTTVCKDNYLIEPKYSDKSLEKIKKNIIKDDVSGCITATGMQSINHDGCQLIEEVPDKVIKVGNYSPSNHNASCIVDTDGVSPTVMENHGTVTAIVEDNEQE